MNRKTFLIALWSVLAMVMIAISLSSFAIPSPVATAYNRALSSPIHELGRCSKDDVTVYFVASSIGFGGGTESYYDVYGRPIGNYVLSDVEVPGQPGPLIDLSSYSCTVLAR